MERTYNVFVDNGLFVLANHINKEVEEITYEDIEKNIDMICNKVETFVNCEKYSNIKDMSFANSTLTQTRSKLTLAEKLKEFLQYKGEEYCEICGEYHATVRNDIGRSYIPNSTAHTFYNFSNNLVGVNVCPYCLILTMFSCLNHRVCGGLVTIYNCNDDRFMKNYTRRLQGENIRDIELNAKKEKELNRFKYLEELLRHDAYYTFVEQYRYNNSGKSQEVEINKISSESIKLLSKLIEEGLLDEFKKFGLMYELTQNRLAYSYLYKIYNFDKEELRCSIELLNFLDKEVNVLEEKRKSLIKRIANSIDESNIDKTKLISTLKSMNSFIDFEGLLIKLQEDYSKSTKDNLLSEDEYTLLDDRIKFKQIKNFLLFCLVLE